MIISVGAQPDPDGPGIAGLRRQLGQGASVRWRLSTTAASWRQSDSRWLPERASALPCSPPLPRPTSTSGQLSTGHSVAFIRSRISVTPQPKRRPTNLLAGKKRVGGFQGVSVSSTQHLVTTLQDSVEGMVTG